MNYKQTINDLLMEVAKLRKDAEYLAGERDYWKQQAQSVSDGCDTYTFKMRDGEDDVVITKKADSREKLEADIRKYRNEHCETSGRVREWLDRQAAITERECDTASWKANYMHMKDRVHDLQEQVDELKAKNAEIREKFWGVESE